MNSSQDGVSMSPSFSSYSSDRLAEIADRVTVDKSNDAAMNEENEDNVDDEDFEFALLCQEDEEPLAEEFIHGRQARPIFPVFNRCKDELSTSRGGKLWLSSNAIPSSRHDHERDYCPPSCSSSEADELDYVAAGEFCVWRPKMADSPLPNQCKKSNSTGSEQKIRWKFRDLLRRNSSEGKDKDRIFFSTPKHGQENSKRLIEAASTGAKGKGAGSNSSGAPGTLSAHEVLYVWNRAIKEGEKKKSYLPYRQDIVGCFANVKRTDRSLPHF